MIRTSGSVCGSAGATPKYRAAVVEETVETRTKVRHFLKCRAFTAVEIPARFSKGRAKLPLSRCLSQRDEALAAQRELRPPQSRPSRAFRPDSSTESNDGTGRASGTLFRRAFRQVAATHTSNPSHQRHPQSSNSTSSRTVCHWLCQCRCRTGPVVPIERQFHPAEWWFTLPTLATVVFR